MDKATSKNKIILGPIRKCGKDIVSDCYMFLSSGSHSKEEIYAKTVPLRTPTDIKHLCFRKNAHKSTVSGDTATECQKTRF